MKKSFAILFGFGFLALMDSLLSYAFPVDFTYQKTSVVWHLFFIGVIVFVHDKPWVTRVLISSLAGLVMDLFFNNSFPADFLLYPVFGFLIGFFEPWLYRTKPAFVIYMMFCFLIDWIPWIFQSVMGLTTIRFVRWFTSMELMTLFANGFAVTLIMYVDLVMVRFFLLQNRWRSQASQKKLQKLRSSTSQSLS